jgi:subtilisin family serine protease
MIDTAVAAHPALNGTRITRRQYGGKAASFAQHGTAVASILASEGTRRLLVADVFRGTEAAPYTSADAIAQSLEWLAENRVIVVNISLAGPRNAILDRLIQRATGHGMIIVAAAGNGGPTAPPAYPAALETVVAVTAVDAHSHVYRYANQGDYISVAAKGVDEPAASMSGGVALFSGTSFATPHISAWVARCLADKRLSAVECRRRLSLAARDAGIPGRDPVYGWGIVDSR